MGLIDILFGNVSECSADALARQYKDILTEGEVIERAFSHIRDKWVFTNKRLIIQDTQGVTGKKKEFLTIPYRSVECYSVESTGTFDVDAELKIHVRGLSHPIEVNFGSTERLMEVQRVLAGYVL